MSHLLSNLDRVAVEMVQRYYVSGVSALALALRLRIGEGTARALLESLERREIVQRVQRGSRTVWLLAEEGGERG